MSLPARQFSLSAPKRSILRQSVGAVLLIESMAAILLMGVAAVHEQHVRFHAFDTMLQGKAAALLGAVQDADDAMDSVVLDTAGLDLPENDIFQVSEEHGRVLGQSQNMPRAFEGDLTRGAFKVRSGGRIYQCITLHGVRVVDPGEARGGKVHHIVVLYGASAQHIRGEVLEAVRFYAVTFALVLLLTASFLAWFLRRALSPLNELATAAEKISTQAWTFEAPRSAWLTRELESLTKAIERSIQKLQQSFEQQRRFTSDAAHELKTDVAIIKSSLQLLTMRRRSAEQYEQGLAVSLRDCERLEETVQEMLTLARVQYAGTTAAKNDEKLADLTWHAHEAVRYLMPMAQLKDVHLTVKGTISSPVMLSDKNSHLLCVNLFQNAVQHSKAGNHVTVEVATSLGFVTMQVQDQGEGIALEILPHVFEPFYRADNARDRKRGGTGLGLAICKAICEKAGGMLTITSEPGNGALVSVRLPIPTSTTL